MKGQQLFMHSVRQVTGNLEDALKISAVPYAIQAVVSLLLMGGAASMGGNPANGAMAGFGLGALVALVVAVVTGLWIAVAWHRFVLLGERAQGFIPAWQGDRMLAYFLRSLAYGLIAVVLAVIWGAIVGIALGWVAMGSIVVFMILIAVLVQLPVVALAFRLSSTLPASALGTERDFMAGWKATEGHTADIIVLAAFAVGANLVLGLIGYALGSLWILALAWQIVVGWLVMMVGVSILTTLYGHYVEGRPLV